MDLSKRCGGDSSGAHEGVEAKALGEALIDAARAPSCSSSGPSENDSSFSISAACQILAEPLGDAEEDAQDGERKPPSTPQSCDSVYSPSEGEEEVRLRMQSLSSALNWGSIAGRESSAKMKKAKEDELKKEWEVEIIVDQDCGDFVRGSTEQDAAHFSASELMDRGAQGSGVVQSQSPNVLRLDFKRFLHHFPPHGGRAASCVSLLKLH